MSARLRVAFLAAGVLAVASPVAAQDPGASSVGVAVGVSSLPRAFSPSCYGLATGRIDGAGGALWGAARVIGTLGIEAQVGGELPGHPRACVPPPTPLPDGPYTSRQEGLAPNGTVSSDVRLRWEPVPVLALTAGGGLLWALHDPYIAFGPRLRTRGRVGLVAAADWRLARFRYEMVTREYRDGVPLRVISRLPGQEWRSLWDARLGVELAVR